MMSLSRTIHRREEIGREYADRETAEQYIDERFVSAWGSVLHEAQVRAINAAIRAAGAKKVLEIAAGPARLSCEVEGFERGYICEFNQSMLRVARKRLESTGFRVQGSKFTQGGLPQSAIRNPQSSWSLMQGDAFRLPLRGSFDLVYTFRFIRHFTEPDRAALYRQIHSVLKDEGLFVFDAINAIVSRPLREKAPEGYRVYDELYEREQLVNELSQHGFRVLSMIEVIRHVKLQQWLQIYIGPRSHTLARSLIRALEKIPGQPLEWCVICQKKGQ